MAAAVLAYKQSLLPDVMEHLFVINSSHSVSVLWAERQSLAVPYVAILGVAAVVGTAGNLLVITTLALMSHRHHRGVGNVFILNLALSDLIVTALINPFSIAGTIKGVSIFQPHFALCRGLASLCVISCVVSLLTIGNIAMNRYVYICQHAFYKQMYSKRGMIVACVASWVMGVLVDLPSHTGWSRHTFDLKSHKCIFDRKYRYEYTLFFVIVGVLSPLLIIVIFYALIVNHIRKAKMRLDQYSNISARAKIVKVVRQTRMMFSIFLAFALCWLPYIVILLTDKEDKLPVETHLMTSMVAHLHASLNFIIYGFANVSFKQGYKDVVQRLFCRCKDIYLTRDYAVDSVDNLSEVFNNIRPVVPHPSNNVLQVNDIIEQAQYLSPSPSWLHPQEPLDIPVNNSEIVSIKPLSSTSNNAGYNMGILNI